MSQTGLIYVVGVIGDPIEVGPIDYDPNLLHVTFLNSLQLPKSKLPVFIASLEKIVYESKPLKVYLEDKVYGFGDHNHIPVRHVVEFIENYHDLHELIKTKALKHGGTFNDKYDYSPHVSHSNEHGHVGIINSIALIHHIDEFGKNVVNEYNFLLEGSCSS